MKKEHEVFIKEMLEHGDKNLAYSKAFPNSTSRASNNAGAWRLMRLPKIKERLKDVIVNDAVVQTELHLAEKEIFACDFVLHNDVKKAYKAAFPEKPFNQPNATAMLRSRYVQAKIKELRAEADKLVIADLKQQREFLFFTYAEKRDLMRRIALGDVTIKKNVWEDGRWVMKDVPVDMADRLRAIDIENRMTGDYSPDRIQVEQYIKGMIINITGEGWEDKAA
jgi:hypothetical protein